MTRRFTPDSRLRNTLVLMAYLVAGYFIEGLIGGVLFILFVYEAEGGGSGNARFASEWTRVGGLVGGAAAVGVWYLRKQRTRGKVQGGDA